ncbi:MAG TPA: MBL fold metallo-hydrolase [Gemmatimonadales bacterium]|nr:MBL fold metallo-hydrolase [Gemmatimonadales bacterium]
MPDVLEITSTELAAALERGQPLQVLDIRAPHRLAAGAISATEPARFFNVPGSKLFALGEAAAVGLDPALPVAVVCGHGNSSRQMAAWLGAQGYDARSLRGGMAAWMQCAIPRPVPPPPGVDRLLQFDRLGKGALSYLLIAGGEAVVIDAPRAFQPLVDAAQQAGARITAVMDTHLHADYLSGGPVLAARLGVPYRLHRADATSPYDGRRGTLAFVPLDEGDVVSIGKTALRVMHTPGHTEGSVTFVGGDTAFTGDFVFVQSVGRPDLAGRTTEWTEDLWRSLERARREWPAATMVRPGHYASETERGPDRSVGAAWGDLLPGNEALRIADPDGFRKWVSARTRDAPDAYRIIKTANLGLLSLDDSQVEELEGGKNECAV